MKLKAVGYVRVSTTEQAVEGISLDMQRSKVRAYADLEDMDLIDIAADEGISGCNIKDRPAIQRVLKMVERREVQAVIIFKLDRLARNTIEALEVSQLMDRRGVALHSITEKLDTKSAIGRFFFTLMASLAEMERMLIAERVRYAFERKREKGESCGNPPYGYSVVNNLLVANPDEWAVIGRVLYLHHQGLSFYRIAKCLAEEGIFSRRGTPFDKSQVRNMVQNREAA